MPSQCPVGLIKLLFVELAVCGVGRMRRTAARICLIRDDGRHFRVAGEGRDLRAAVPFDRYLLRPGDLYFDWLLHAVASRFIKHHIGEWVKMLFVGFSTETPNSLTN